MTEGMWLWVDVQDCFQRGFARGWACGDGVVAGKKLPAVLVGIEDGERERAEREGDVLRFAWGEFHPLPRGEALVVFAGGGRKSDVDLRDFGTFGFAGVADGEF